MNKILLSCTMLLFLFCAKISFAGVVANEKGLCGYQDDSGKLTIDYLYNYIGQFNEKGVAVAKKGSKFGMIDKNGNVLLPFKYSFIGKPDKHGISQIQSGKKYGLVQDDGTLLMKPSYEWLGQINNMGNLFAKTKIKQNYQQIISIYGKTITKGDASYAIFVPVDTMYEFTTKTISVPKHISSTNKKNIIPNDTKYFIEGNNVIRYDGSVCTNEGKYLKTKPTKCIHNSTNKLFNHFCIIMPPTQDIMPFYEIYTKTTDSIGVVLGYYNLLEKKTIKHFEYSLPHKKIKFNPFSVKESINFWEEKFGFTTTTIESNEYYLNAFPFSYGYAIIKTNNQSENKYILINKQGETVGEYEKIYPFHEGYAVVAKNSMGGLIDTTLNMVVPFKYHNYTVEVDNNQWVVQTDDKKWRIVNTNDEIITKKDYDYIISGNAGWEKLWLDGKFGLSENGKKHLNCEYDSIKYYGGKVEEDDNRIYIAYKGRTPEIYSPTKEKTYKNFTGIEGVYDFNDSKYYKTVICVYNYGDDGKPRYGFVNSDAELFVPIIFSDDEIAYKAAKYYSNFPTQSFTETDCFRMKLRFSRLNQFYEITDIIPDREWDY